MRRMALKSIIIETKISLQVFKGRFELEKEGIGESEVSCYYSGCRTKKKKKKNEQCSRDLCRDMHVYQCIHNMGPRKERDRKQWKK